MIYVLLGTGFEEIEALTPVDLLRRAGYEVCTVGLDARVVYGSHKIGVQADIQIEELNPVDAELVVVPGGLGGVAAIRGCRKALDAVKYAYEHGKFVAAICAGPTVLADLGITDGKRATCYPGCENGMGKADMVKHAAVVRDGNIITGTSAGCATKFALALIEALGGENLAQKIQEQIVVC